MTDIDYYSKLNLIQKSSETNLTIIYRYRQFYLNLENREASLVILDVGCNTGRGGKVLKILNNNFIIYGIDCLEERLEQAKRIYDVVLKCDTTALPLKDRTVDCTLAGEFIEHLLYEDAVTTLNEFYRILRPGGQIFLTTPNPGYLKLKVTGASILGGAHLSQYYPQELKEIMRNIGFSQIVIKGSGRVAKYLGDFWPFMLIYGSYLLTAKK